MRSQSQRFNEVFGSADPPDLSDRLIALAVSTTDAEIEKLIADFPLSHNALFAVVTYYHGCDNLDLAFRHAAIALALYPESPILRRWLVSAVCGEAEISACEKILEMGWKVEDEVLAIRTRDEYFKVLLPR